MVDEADNDFEELRVLVGGKVGDPDVDKVQEGLRGGDMDMSALEK